MALKIKCHTVPHLKGLNSCLEPLIRCRRGCTYTLHYNTVKRTHFASKQAKQRFYLNTAVCRSCFKILIEISSGSKTLNLNWIARETINHPDLIQMFSSWNFNSDCWRQNALIWIQSWNFGYARLLNKPHENRVTLREQNWS